MTNKASKIINWSILATAIISLVLGTAGWHDYYLQLNKESDIWNSLFLGLQLFTMNSAFEDIHVPLALNIARFTAPASLAGAIIKVILLLTRNHYHYLHIRLFFRGHIIICGLTRRARAIVKDITGDGKQNGIVIIDNNDEPERALGVQGKGIIHLGESTASIDLLMKAGLKKAKHVLLLDEDQQNLETLEELKKTSFQGKVILHLSDSLAANLYKEMSNRCGISNLHVITDANILATRLVDHYSPDRFISIKNLNDPPVHILLAGDNPFLLNLAREAGIMYHFANLKKTKFTFVVPGIDEFRKQLDCSLPHLSQVVDFSIIDYQQIWQLDSGIELDDVSVCLISTRVFAHGLELGRRFRQIFFDANHTLESPRIALVASLAEDQQPIPEEMVEKLNILHLDYCNGISHFSAQTVIHDMEVYDTIAKFIHNSFSVREDQSYTDAENMWNSISDAEKDWNRWPARHFHIKLRVLGARVANSGEEADGYNLSSITNETRYLLARMEKHRWDAEKWLTGFVPGQYQEDKELEKKLKREFRYHPALKPWEEISEEERRKDAYAFNDIQQILKKAGMKIVHDR